MLNSTLNSTNTPGEATFNLYGYEPAKTPAYAYLALFALVAAVHFIMMFPLRAAFFIPLIIGCSGTISFHTNLLSSSKQSPSNKHQAEAGAYYLRVWSSEDTHKILPFVLSSLLILAAPPLLAATIYMTFGRLIRCLHGEACSLLSPKWQTTIFVLGDLFCLCSQLAGSYKTG
ncbi:uncharacterized protein PAC_01237 [Phialocephala subalpina]|uniref:Uncharacterized protein n=1 Tax=Phialocephala subalpina TaxID=576137 RepID=A0A1L7WF06_9HELO|nr:uncharacterized protein PAC_01237 [Phialocephala subalpina]